MDWLPVILSRLGGALLGSVSSRPGRLLPSATRKRPRPELDGAVSVIAEDSEARRG
jgi:hypothetical protein